jgi:ferredoxin
MATVTVKIDSSACIAASACVDTASKFFRLDEDNVANVIGSDGEGSFQQELEVSDAEKKMLEDAAQACPTGAIQVKG